MISVNEAKELIKANIRPLPPKPIAIIDALDCILAKTVYAQCDVPAFRQSAVDGYAFAFEDKQQAYQLTGEMAAGSQEQNIIKNGETSRIFTGAPLPIGADTVVMQEKTSAKHKKITFKDQQLTLGANVREQGAEIKAGSLAMPKGSLLNPVSIGFLAGLGIAEVEVFPRPKVAIIVTGNELQTPGQPLQFGQVYEANSYSLTAALKKEGIAEITVFKSRDDIEELTNVLNSALAYDMVLLTGGVSVGDYDYVPEASKRCGIRQIFHKVKQRPGKPLFFGAKDSKSIFGLPGNPASVLSCYFNYVLPAVKYLSNKEDNPITTATLTHSYQKTAGLTHFLKGMYKDGKTTALFGQESYRLSSFAQADCLIQLEENMEEVQSGITVSILPLFNP